MLIERLIPQIRALARAGLGHEDIRVRLRIEKKNWEIVRRVVLNPPPTRVVPAAENSSAQL